MGKLRNQLRIYYVLNNLKIGLRFFYLLYKSIKWLQLQKKEIENERPVFPFTAIIGQEEMKLALILNVIDPRIGGVMIMGDRGTGKSTTIRAVADLLPAIKVAADDPFNSSITDYELMSETVKMAVENNEELDYEFRKVPMVDLPLGATEDRVCGTIDIEKALTEGVRRKKKEEKIKEV